MWLQIVIFTLLSRGLSAENKRNVLLILADDGGFEMGAYLNDIVQTPNLDALAKQSLLFNNAYTSVSSCSPSRAALLTGMPSHQNGMYGLHQAENNFNSLNTIQSLPKILSNHSIRTGIIGKKHVGPSSIYKFDYEQTEENNHINQVGRNITHIKLLAREFLKDTGSQPFFLYVAFHDPHRCGHTNPEFGEFCQRFGNGEPGMGNIEDWHPIHYVPEQIRLPYYIPDTIEARRDVAAQYITLSRLDQGVGLLMEELRAAGHSDDTLVLYASDNGPPFPNGRTNLYDSGMATPMFISSPLKEHHPRMGQVTYSLTSLLDVMPTILDWFGITRITDTSVDHNILQSQPELTGKSLLPLLVNEPLNKTNEAIFASHNLHEVTMYYPMRAIRTHRYKLIHNLNSNAAFPIDQDFYLSPTFQNLLNNTRNKETTYWFKTLREYYYRPEWELFDLKMDPEETNNIAGKPSVKQTMAELSQRLQQWQKDTKDPWLCAPHAVYEDKGLYKDSPSCLPLYNE